MKISNGTENLTQIPPSQTSPSVKAQQSTANPAQTAHAGDKANLSATGTQVAHSAATATVSGVSDIRLDKVASIQAALQAGSYRVPASDVARKVVDAMLSQEPSSKQSL
jgi:negative regulator of flagellin synthesis FlgM